MGGVEKQSGKDKKEKGKKKEKAKTSSQMKEDILDELKKKPKRKISDHSFFIHTI